MEFFLGGGRISVNVFVIISSWYLVDKTFTFKRILSTWVSTLIYSAIVGGYFAFTLGNFEIFAFHLLPISTNVIWFMRAYILMLLMTPVLNYLLEMPQLKKFLIILFAVFSIYKTLYPGNVLDIGDWEVFLFIYLITGYIKKNKQRYILKRKTFLFLFLLAYFTNILWYVYYYEIINILPFLTKFGYGRYMFNIYVNNIQCMLGGFALFGYFKTLHIGRSRLSNIISWFSDGTLGVYILLAMNSPEGYLWWIDLIKVRDWIYGDHLLPKIYLLIIILFVFTVCIDHVRAFAVNRLMKIKRVTGICSAFDRFYTTK